MYEANQGQIWQQLSYLHDAHDTKSKMRKTRVNF